MKKFKKFLLIVLSVLLFATPIFTACEFTIFSSTQLKSPVISLIESSNCLSWENVTNAKGYDIYCNDRLSESIVATKDEKILYDLSSILEETGLYKFAVRSTTDVLNMTNSELSNEVSYEYVKKEIVKPNDDSYGEITTQDNIDFTIDKYGNLTYIPLSNSEILNYKYYVYVYSNTTGLNNFELNSNPINLIDSSIITKVNDIYAVRLAYQDAEGIKIDSKIQYYNSKDFGEYTKKIYLFDGCINDYYIETIPELNNLVYYTFINRIVDFNIKISEEFKTTIKNDSQTLLVSMNNIVAKAFENSFETKSYRSDNVGGGFVSKVGANDSEYKIKVDYGGFSECYLNINKTNVLEQNIATPYYETVSYEMLDDECARKGAEYNFASDKQFLYTEVTTSEQLYWAVENKITPVITDANSRAGKIYKKAKDVLKRIISNEMTDYEKALSIFDWIAVNTRYDYSNYSKTIVTLNNGKNLSPNDYPTLLPNYYLEGVFLEGFAVCDGFSKSFSLMCNMLGIDAIRVTGTAGYGNNRGGHAWNKVLMDPNPTDTIAAKYYLVDITWTEINSGKEELSHTYFGLSDADVKDTHTPFEGRRDRYDKYKSPSNARYYETQKSVVSSDQEMKDMFQHLFDKAYPTIEFVVDYDYMVSKYNENHPLQKYKTSNKKDITYVDKSHKYKETEYDYKTDTMTVYQYQTDIWQTQYVLVGTYVIENYQLRNEFQNIVMRASKLKQQYLFISQVDKTIQYNNQGNVGCLYIIEQNLLIDETQDIESLKTLISNANGKYKLYVKTDILNKYLGENSIAKLSNMLGIDLNQIKSIQDNVTVNDDLTASIFEIVVTKNA